MTDKTPELPAQLNKAAHRLQGALLVLKHPQLAALVGPFFDAVCAASEAAWETTP